MDKGKSKTKELGGGQKVDEVHTVKKERNGASRIGIITDSPQEKRKGNKKKEAKKN